MTCRGFKGTINNNKIKMSMKRTAKNKKEILRQSQGSICSVSRSEKLHNFGQLLIKLELD